MTISPFKWNRSKHQRSLETRVFQRIKMKAHAAVLVTCFLVLLLLYCCAQMEQQQDFYHLLQVSKQSDLSQIKKSYRNLARKFRPDAPRNNQLDFQAISRAYQVLSDPQLRTIYDEKGHAGVEAFEATQQEESIRNNPWSSFNFNFKQQQEKKEL